MQPDYKYKTYRPKSVSSKTPTYDYKPSTFSTTPLTDEERTKQRLQSQKENLQERLEAVGVNPDDLSKSAVDNRSIMEKALNLEDDQGMLMDLFEVMDRPVQMTKGLIKGLAEGENPFESAWEGLSGQTEVSSAELMQDLGLIEDPDQLGGFGKFAVNVAGDILLDPLTYFGGPVAWMKKSGLLGKKSLTNNVTNNVLKKANKLTGSDAYKSVDDIFKRYDDIKGLDAASLDDADKFIKESVFDEKGLLSKFSAIDSETGKVIKRGELKQASGKKVRFRKKGATKPGTKGQKGEERAAQGLFKLFNNKFASITEADDLFLASEKAANTFNDIEVFYRSGDKYLKSAVKMDVKDMVAQGVTKVKKSWANLYGPHFKVGANGTLEIGDSIGEALGDKDIMQSLLDVMEEIADKPARESIQDIVGRITKSTSGRLKTYVGDKVQPEELSKLNDALKKVFKAKYKDEFIVIPFLDDVKIFKSDTIADQLDFKVALQRSGKKGKLGKPRLYSEIKPSEVFDINQADDTEAFLSEMFNFERTDGLIGRMINQAAASKYAILSAPANIWKEAEAAVKYAFSYTAGLPRELIGKIKGIQGKAGQRMMRFSNRLATLQKSMVSTNDDAGRILSNIAEYAEIDNTGNLVARSREYAAADILDSMQTQLMNGNDIILPPTLDKTARKNFLDTLNKLDRKYKDVVGPLNARIIKSSDSGMKISVDLTAKELKELMTAIDPVDAQGLIKFGRRQLDDEMKELYAQHGDEITEFLKLKDDVTGVLIDELGFNNLPDEMKGTLGYLRHSLSDAAKKRMKAGAPVTRTQYISGGTDVLKSRNYLGTIEETNAAMREFMGLDYDLLDADAFNSMEDLIRITNTKEEQGKLVAELLNGADANGNALFKKMANSQEALDQLGPDFKVFDATGNFKDEFPRLYKNLSPEAQDAITKHFDQFSPQEGEIFAMHKSAYGIMKSAEKAYVELPKSIKMFDKFMNTWKGITLVSPGFHMRNLFGNMTNSYLAGMGFTQQARYSTKAFKDFNIYKRFKGAVAEGGLDAIPDKTQREAFERVLDYFESGVAQTHKGIRDLEGVKQSLKLTGPKSGYDKLLQANFNFAEKADDVQRYMLYQWGMDSSREAIEKEMAGASAEAIRNRIRNTGSEKVSEALFDYSHLTSFEKEYMKRIFPFYTFMKNNLVFQAKNMFYKTGRYAALGRAYDYWNEDMAGLSTEDMPDYMQDNMWLPLPMLVQSDDEEAISFLKLNLPVSDFTELVENPFKKGVSSISVPFKMLMELGFGRDSFTDQELVKYPGEANRMKEGEGALSFLRAEDGTLALSRNPLTQKLADDLGLRVPKNYASIALDLIDGASGYQNPQSTISDVTERLGLAGVTETQRIELTGLYQDLERLRNLRSIYEQEEGSLPTLDELGLGN